MEVCSLFTIPASARLVVGIKQLKKALRDKTVSMAYVAQDAETRVTAPILDLCREAGVEVTMVPTMRELGEACGIEVGAAAAGVLR